jgi:phosphoadenosine phosphosulfate reductase
MSVMTKIAEPELLVPEELVAQVVAEYLAGRDAADGAHTLGITCSFQTEDMVVLHMLRQHMPDVPVLFLDTGYHFAETYAYRDRMAAEWKLNLSNMMPKSTVAEQEAKYGLLYIVQPTDCCQMRKVEPLMRTLEDYTVWFTGLRREQSPTRAKLRVMEEHKLPTGKVLDKVSPLASWTWAQVEAYAAEHKIPVLPLYEQGYLSIGCEPCTSISTDPANPRAGRWSGNKLECGIHTFTTTEK